MADEPIESKRPRRSVALGILGPVLLLLVGTASAQEQGIQQPGGDACPSTISSAGFLDIGDLSSESVHAIDCLAHYGITTGTSTTTYSPGDYLTRSQMARFLIRTAGALGVELPAGDSAPFEDISGLGANGRRSVVQLYELGITTGRRPGVFDPDALVNRRQMVLFLSRTLAAAGIEGEADPDALPYSDLEGWSDETVNAVAGLAALGIEWPAATDLFEPVRPVTREEAALLLAGTLEAGDARHVVLAIEVSSTVNLHNEAIVVTVTATKPNGSPYRGLLVDMFVSGIGHRHDGTCFLVTDAWLYGVDAGTSEDCVIDRADPRTNYLGQIKASLAHAPRRGTSRIHAWVGDLGQEFRESRPHQVSVRVEWVDVPDRIEIDGPIDARYDEVIEVEVRLVGSNRGGRKLVMMVIRDGITVHTVWRTTPYSGRVSFVYAGPDDPSSNNDEELVEIIRVFWDRNDNWIHDGPAEISDEITVTWDD
ncbi:MAG: hypothetical protein F4X74_11055 [Acidimicrobiia bacterium]|nr:hypothetical protein [Acidimicrobiia bacterium]